MQDKYITVVSQDLLSFTNKAFSRSLSRDKWKELTTSRTQMKYTESFLVAPMMEAWMKEDVKKRGMVTLTQRNSLPLMMAWQNVNPFSWLWLGP